MMFLPSDIPLKHKTTLISWKNTILEDTNSTKELLDKLDTFVSFVYV